MALTQVSVYSLNTTGHDEALKRGLGFESSSNNHIILTGHQTENKCQ